MKYNLQVKTLAYTQGLEDLFDVTLDEEPLVTFAGSFIQIKLSDSITIFNSSQIISIVVEKLL